jgi:hypothetical protein
VARLAGERTKAGAERWALASVLLGFLKGSFTTVTG